MLTPPDMDLAHFIVRRAQRSVYLIDGLRRALDDFGRPDLVAVLDLVGEDARQVLRAGEQHLAQRRSAKSTACSTIQAQWPISPGSISSTAVGGGGSSPTASRAIGDAPSNSHPSFTFRAWARLERLPCLGMPSFLSHAETCWAFLPIACAKSDWVHPRRPLARAIRWPSVSNV